MGTHAVALVCQIMPGGVKDTVLLSQTVSQRMSVVMSKTDGYLHEFRETCHSGTLYLLTKVSRVQMML